MKLLESDESDLQSYILVVVNDSELRRHIRNVLDKQGLIVMTAGMAKEALKLTGAAIPNTVLVGLDLPGCDGVNLLSDLRKYTSTSVISLSTGTSLSEEISVLDSGADDYLNIPTKPFCFKKLLARVRVLLRRPAPEEENPVQPKHILTETGMGYCLAV